MSGDAFAPRIEAVPESVARGAARALGEENPAFRRLEGGTTGRTFEVRGGGRRAVLRIERCPARQLPRAAAAQALAAASRVAVPEILASGEDAEHAWLLEAYVDGIPFDHDGFARPDVRAAAVDLGRQLRRLHAAEVPADGPIPRWEWYPGRIERAVRTAGLDADERARLDDVYALLRAAAPAVPRLCKGDCSGANLLVAGGSIAAIVDWEWAFAGDPASDAGAWHSRNSDPRALDLLLEGYEPDDEPFFRRRVAAHQIAGAVEEIAVFNENVHVFGEREREEGIRTRTRWLRDGLSRW